MTRPAPAPRHLRRLARCVVPAAVLGVVLSTAAAPAPVARAAVPRTATARAALPAAGTAAPTPATATPTASSSAPGSSPAALVDGAVAQGRLGAEWAASPSDASPWVQLTWPSAHRVASVQVFGSTSAAFDPAQSTAAALHGTVRFSDGSSVVVSGIAAGAGMPTLVAFPAHTTTSVRLELARQVPTAQVALRELTAYDAGTTPPVWRPTAAAAYSATPQTASCSATTAPVATAVAVTAATAATSPTSPVLPALVCPAVGAAVGDRPTVVVAAPPGTTVSAWGQPASALTAATPLVQLATATADARGRAVLAPSAAQLPRGPVALVVVRGTALAASAPRLHVQLFHTTGTTSTAGTTAPAGMTLAYADDFSSALSVSSTGWGSQYAAVKPEPWGGSQFGDAVFADPAAGAGTLATLPGGYLRLRAQPIGRLAPTATWGQQYAAGILSSQRSGGSGVSAQDGYFEVRMLGGPGPGAWPAFWMLDSESGTGRSDRTAGELDAVELYGHDTTGACQTTHSWGGSGGAVSCQAVPRGADWAAGWHTYGVKVRDGGADFFVDGVRTASLSGLSHTDEPFFFMIDMALGGGWPTDLSATGGISDTYVDWVRVWS